MHVVIFFISRRIRLFVFVFVESHQVERASVCFCANNSALCRVIYEGLYSGGPRDPQTLSALLHCTGMVISIYCIANGRCKS
jgi:hypothetical protein